MLFFNFFSPRFILLIQSGFYLDFFFKKFCEVFIKNIYIYTALFFGEKYFIEILTKKVIDSFVFNNNKKIWWSTLNYLNFFNVIIYIFVYIFILNSCFYLFF